MRDNLEEIRFCKRSCFHLFAYVDSNQHCLSSVKMLLYAIRQSKLFSQ